MRCITILLLINLLLHLGAIRHFLQMIDSLCITCFEIPSQGSQELRRCLVSSPQTRRQHMFSEIFTFFLLDSSFFGVAVLSSEIQWVCPWFSPRTNLSYACSGVLGKTSSAGLFCWTVSIRVDFHECPSRDYPMGLKLL